MRTAHRAWHWIGLSAATFGSITVLTLSGAGCSGGVPKSTAAATAAAATAAPLDGVELSAGNAKVQTGAVTVIDTLLVAVV